MTTTKGFLKKDLYKIAKDLNIKGRSTMSKEGLETAIANAKKTLATKQSPKAEPKKTSPKQIYEYIQENIEGKNVYDHLPDIDMLTLYSMKKQQHQDMKIVRVIDKMSDLPANYKQIIEKQLYEKVDSKVHGFLGTFLNKYKFILLFRRFEFMPDWNGYLVSKDSGVFGKMDTLFLIEIAPDVTVVYRERNNVDNPENSENYMKYLYVGVYIRKNATFSISDSEVEKDPLFYCKLFDKEASKHIGKISIWDYSKTIRFNKNEDQVYISAFKKLKPKPFDEKRVRYKKVEEPKFYEDYGTWVLKTVKNDIEIRLEMFYGERDNIALFADVYIQGEYTMNCFLKNCEVYRDMTQDELTQIWSTVYSVLSDFFGKEKEKNAILKFHKYNNDNLKANRPSIYEKIIPRIIKQPTFNMFY